MAVVAVVTLAVHRRHRHQDGARLAAFALRWLSLPPAALWLAGQATPLYTERYLVFCLPALVLLAGWALAAAGRRTAVVALVAFLVLGLPQQAGLRAPTGHGEDVGAVLAVLDDQGRPGDAVVFEQQSTRLLAEAYPAVFERLGDVTAGTSGAVSGTLGGTSPARPCRTIPARVRGHHRVWLVAGGRPVPDLPAAVALAAMPDYHPVRSWQGRPYTLTLYVHGRTLWEPSGASDTRGAYADERFPERVTSGADGHPRVMARSPMPPPFRGPWGIASSHPRSCLDHR